MTIVRRSYLLILALGVAILGTALGIAASRHFMLLEEFPRVMAFRLILSETFKILPADAELKLLNIYEDDVKRQSGWFGSTKFNWTQELIDTALQRYVLYTAARRPELAEKALRRAAMLRKNKPPSTEDIEFERQVALRLFPRINSTHD